MRDLVNRKTFLLLFTLLIIVNGLPLTVKYLPFGDIHGHMGIVGALLHYNDPAAHIHDLYTLNLRAFLPSEIFHHAVWLLGHVLPVPWAANLYVFALCIAGPPLALVYLLGVFGRDRRLALLLFPTLYYRCIWYGFVNYMAAVPFALVGVGLLQQLFTVDDERTNKRMALLALMSVMVTESHFFGAMLFYCFAAVVLTFNARNWSVTRLWKAAVGLLPGALFLAVWLVPMLGKHDGGGQAFSSLLHTERSPKYLIGLFYDWNIFGILTPLANWVMAGCYLSIGACAVYAVGKRRAARWLPLALLVASVILFIVVPKSTPSWWSINVRVIPFVTAFAILAIPPLEELPTALLIPGILAGLTWGLYLTWDFHTYFAVDTAGLDQALDAIPPGMRVQGLRPAPETHYAQIPLQHIVNQYIVRRGGIVDPMLGYVHDPNDVLILPHPTAPSPPWGIAEYFSYEKYGRGWDYFLVREPRNGALLDITRGAPADALTLVESSGLWRVYRNNRETH